MENPAALRSTRESKIIAVITDRKLHFMAWQHSDRNWRNTRGYHRKDHKSAVSVSVSQSGLESKSVLPQKSMIFNSKVKSVLLYGSAEPGALLKVCFPKCRRL